MGGGSFSEEEPLYPGPAEAPLLQIGGLRRVNLLSPAGQLHTVSCRWSAGIPQLGGADADALPVIEGAGGDAFEIGVHAILFAVVAAALRIEGEGLARVGGGGVHGSQDRFFQPIHFLVS